MPIYEFKCPNGHITEKKMSIKDNTKELPCDSCESISNRIISSSTFHFKSGGFYHTDYVQINTSVGKED